MALECMKIMLKKVTIMMITCIDLKVIKQKENQTKKNLKLILVF